jgi:hypothetical protein
MHEFSSLEGRLDRSKKVDRDERLRRTLDNLRKENGQLKNLVIRLSETIIRNVTARG